MTITGLGRAMWHSGFRAHSSNLMCQLSNAQLIGRHQGASILCSVKGPTSYLHVCCCCSFSHACLFCVGHLRPSGHQENVIHNACAQCRHNHFQSSAYIKPQPPCQHLNCVKESTFLFHSQVHGVRLPGSPVKCIFATITCLSVQ